MKTWLILHDVNARHGMNGQVHIVLPTGDTSRNAVYQGKYWNPGKHDTLNLRWLNIRPTAKSVAHHWYNSELSSCFAFYIYVLYFMRFVI